MAIRNTLLGGTDFTEEGLKPTDFNDTNDSMITLAAVGVAENSYKILQVADVFTNGPNTAADEFTDATGTNNTVNLATTTAIFNGTEYNSLNSISGDNTLHNPDTFTNPSNAFDGDISTFAYWSVASATTITKNLGETFAAPTYIGKISSYFTYYASGGGVNTVTVTVYTYNGSIWTSVGTLFSTSLNGSSLIGGQIKSMNIDATVSGIRIQAAVYSTSAVSNEFKAYSIEYGPFGTKTVVCDASTITLDGTEKALIVSTPDTTFETGSSMTVTASDGTTSTSAQTINTTSKNTGVFSISTLSSGTLKLTFTLATSDTTKSTLFKGYGVYIIR